MRQRGSRPNEQGFVLVCVLWVVVILTIVTIGFGRRAMLERRAAAYSLDEAQAALMARGAVQRGIVEIRNRMYMNMLRGEMAGSTHAGQDWAKPNDLLTSGTYFDVGDNFKDDEVTYVIEDNERRVDINAVQESFLNNLEIISQGARRDIWTRRTKGEHKDEPPMPFVSPAEVRYLRSVKDDDWFGKKGKPGIKDVITVHGGPVINFNTALPEVLRCVPRLKPQVIDAILHYRAGGDGELYTGDDQGFANLDALKQKIGVNIDDDSATALATYCKADSWSFKIDAIATRRAGKVRAACTAVVQANPNAGEPNQDVMLIVAWQEAAIGS